MKNYSLVLLLSICSSSFGMTDNWNTAEHFSENKDEALFIVYITGAGNAILAMNATLSTPMYCQPTTLSLNYKNYVAIAEKEISRAKIVYGKHFNTLPIEYLVMDGLKNTFPCDMK